MYKNLIGLIILVSLIGACTQQPPVKEIADARLAIISALKAKAGTYAPDKLLKSERYLKLAIIKNRQQNYKEALTAAQRSQELAKNAKAIAEQQKNALIEKKEGKKTAPAAEQKTASPKKTVSPKQSKAVTPVQAKPAQNSQTQAKQAAEKPAIKTAAAKKIGAETRAQAKPAAVAEKETGTAGATPSTKASTGAAAYSDIAEQLEYNKILSDYLGNKNMDVVSKYAEFLKKYPESKFAANAIYWSGEYYYDKLNYSKALEYFKRVATEFPESYKASAAQLKIGYCYYEMGMYDRAIKELKLVEQKYPNSDEMPKALAKIDKIKKEQTKK